MPRVQRVKARKDYPNDGIKKGDTYFKWSIRTGRRGITYRNLKRPRASQLTGSDKKSRLYSAAEAATCQPQYPLLTGGPIRARGTGRLPPARATPGTVPAG